MRVKLKVLQGGSAGKEIAVSSPQFFIGRAEGCHIRLKSDMVSRKHCEITVGKEGISVRDLGSRNGTLVNEEKIDGPKQLKSGDTIRVGPLVFELVVDHAAAGAKRPKVQSVKEAAARTADGGKAGAIDDDDVSSWLLEADAQERARRMSDPETRQFKLDETAQQKLQEAADSRDADDKKKKKEPGKLPVRPQDMAKNSHEAAEKTLKRLFGQTPPKKL